jgi:3-oxoacyl-[acyl-carrier protein] reductase
MMRAVEDSWTAGTPEDLRKANLARIPLGKYAQPADVANLVVWLMSDEARHVTGSIYEIDGGVMAGS